ncbi:hypothetical protein GCM10010129_74240 [Streptomyces fumigatiscleroticus]|nr:hypothetical protein GCM10010129_74240 [Streptomyces fumigatiscleroticus]
MGPWQEAWQRIHTPAPAAARRTARDPWLSALNHPLAYEALDPTVVDQAGQRGGAAPTLSRTFVGLDPADQVSVLAAGLTDLAIARGRARRNGITPDTGTDAFGIHDGKLVLIHCKHSGDTASGRRPASTAPRPPLSRPAPPVPTGHNKPHRRNPARAHRPTAVRRARDGTENGAVPSVSGRRRGRSVQAAAPREIPRRGAGRLTGGRRRRRRR